MTTVAFIGLGNMGLPMAKNLVGAGFDVQGFDLSADLCASLDAAGGKGFSDMAAAVSNADAVVTMLPNGNIVKNVYLGGDGILASAKKGALLIDSSTIDVETAREVAAAAAGVGFKMVDAPVSGGISGAAAGTLAFMIGGADADVEQAKVIIDPMAGKMVHAGGSGNGQAAKICNNMALAIQMISMGEAFNLGRSLGVEDQVLYDIMSGASAQCWSLTTYCPVPGPVPTSPANNDYEPGFATALMHKDLGLAMEAASGVNANTPLGKMSADLYAQMADSDMGDKDFSGMINFLRK